jgi:hypothetical protein
MVCFMDPVYLSCDSANVDPVTLQCSQPVWVVQPSLLPSLSAIDGGLIGFAILAIWAVAYMSRALRVAD